MIRNWKAIRFSGALATVMMLVTSEADSQVLNRVSVANGGAQSADASYRGVLSNDGQVIVFESDASNLVASDTNGVRDIFVRLLATAQTVRASIGVGGAQSNGASRRAALDASGRYVAFESDATNLVAGDTNDVTDVFVVDLLLNTTRRVSVATGGIQSVGASGQPSISGNGRFVAFFSEAQNLVLLDTNGRADVFVHDLLTGITTRVNVSSAGAQALLGDSYMPSLTTTGRHLAFHSDANNLVSGDTNGKSDVFVHDRDPDGNSIFDEGNGTTARVSVHTDGTEGLGDSKNPSLSGNGSQIAFESTAPNLVAGDTNLESDIFVRDRVATTTTRVSVATGGGQADAGSHSPSLSRNGLVVGFESFASNLAVGVPFGQQAVYLHTIAVGVTQHVGVNSAGDASDSDTLSIRLSEDGRWSVFASAASNLVPNDTNRFRDIFLRDRIELSFSGTPRAGENSRFELDNAIGDTGNLLLVLVSCSGNDGFALPNGRIIPLTFDACTVFGLQVSNLLSALVDGTGQANTPLVPFPPLAVGTVLRAVGTTIGVGGFRTITGPIAVTVIN